MVDWNMLFLTAVCLGFGALVQSILGFGMGMVAIPLLVSTGYTLPQAIGALLPNVLMHTLFSCWQYRHDLPWSDAGVMCFYRYLSLPIGIAVLGVVADQGQAWSRALLGAALLVALLVQQLPLPANPGPPSAKLTALAGVSSGFFAGLIGMGGPPLVLWVMEQDWTTQRQRCFLWLSFLLVTPLQMVVMAWRFGQPWAEATVYGLAVVPLVAAIAWQAGILSANWSKDRLRGAMRLFLLLIAVRLIWQWAIGHSA